MANDVRTKRAVSHLELNRRRRQQKCHSMRRKFGGGNENTFFEHGEILKNLFANPKLTTKPPFIHIANLRHFLSSFYFFI